MHPYDILRRPLITEKSAALQAQFESKYAFEVAVVANKPQIREAVEKAFKVKVTAVNVMTVPGKGRRVGRRQVLTRPWKKAIVTLSPGDKIEIFEGI
ncbi:50S ribosomal protein L23 [Chloroflexota bacterium]